MSSSSNSMTLAQILDLEDRLAHPLDVLLDASRPSQAHCVKASSISGWYSTELLAGQEEDALAAALEFEPGEGNIRQSRSRNSGRVADLDDQDAVVGQVTSGLVEDPDHEIETVLAARAGRVAARCGIRSASDSSSARETYGGFETITS